MVIGWMAVGSSATPNYTSSVGQPLSPPSHVPPPPLYSSHLSQSRDSQERAPSSSVDTQRTAPRLLQEPKYPPTSPPAASAAGSLSRPQDNDTTWLGKVFADTQDGSPRRSVGYGGPSPDRRRELPSGYSGTTWQNILQQCSPDMKPQELLSQVPPKIDSVALPPTRSVGASTGHYFPGERPTRSAQRNPSRESPTVYPPSPSGWTQQPIREGSEIRGSGQPQLLSSPRPSFGGAPPPIHHSMDYLKDLVDSLEV